MGHTRKRGKSWQGIVYVAEEDRHVPKTFRTREQAKAWVNDQEHKLHDGTWTRPEDERLRFSAVAEDWLAIKRATSKATGKPTEKHIINIDGHLRNHLLPVFGRKPIGKIRSDDVQKLVNSLTEKGLGPDGTKAAYRTFTQITTRALQRRLISQSPCIGIVLPEAIRPDHKFLEPEEVDRLATCIDPRFKAAVLIAAYGGLRASEVWGLTREHFNPLRGTVAVVEVLSEIHGRQVTKGPKSKSSKRLVWLPQDLVQEINDHIEACDKVAQKQKRLPSKYVFPAPLGGPQSHSTFMGRYYKPALQAAGLSCTFHTLRHSCASLLAHEGWKPQEISEHLGHARTSITLDTYVHLFREDPTSRIERLNERLRQAKNGAVVMDVVNPPVTALKRA